MINTSYSFAARATDPDGDRLRYGFDWDNNGTVDFWTPLVNSGTSQSSTRIWAATGLKTFKVLTQDARGANSAWASHAINITQPPIPTLTLTANPTSVTYGDSSQINWTTTNATSCWSSGDWGNGWRIVNGSEIQTSIFGGQTYIMECWSATGISTGQKSVTLDYSCTPDSTCDSNSVLWDGNCAGDCSVGAMGFEAGICDNGCGGAGTTTRSCRLDCPVEFDVDGYRETSQ